MANELLALVKQAGEYTADAFNRGDFEEAFGYLGEDIEWHLPAELPDSRVLHGSDEVVAFYEQVRATFPDWRSEERTYRLVGELTVFVHHRMAGTGGISGASVGSDVFQVMELGENGAPKRMREFLNRGDAEEAAGVKPSS